MAVPTYTAADYLAALQSLMPRGRVWPRDADAVQTKVLSGLSVVYERSTARSVELLVDAFPATAYELLGEWEASLGLPSACSGQASTLQGRRSEVVAKLCATGGQSVPYITDVARTLGFDITVTTFAPFRAGRNRAGDPAQGPAWAHTWAVNSPQNTYTHFRAGQSLAGERVRIWGNAVLECALGAIKPAHTVLQFRYA